jgi:hypothetical protein
MPPPRPGGQASLAARLVNVDRRAAVTGSRPRRPHWLGGKDGDGPSIAQLPLCTRDVRETEKHVEARKRAGQALPATSSCTCVRPRAWRHGNGNVDYACSYCERAEFVPSPRALRDVCVSQLITACNGQPHPRVMVSYTVMSKPAKMLTKTVCGAARYPKVEIQSPGWCSHLIASFRQRSIQLHGP